MSVTILPQPRIRFSPLWEQVLEKHLASWVKSAYLPARRQKSGRTEFGEHDVRFFAPSVIDLSELFQTRDRKKLARYFSQARFRSAYFLYFLPLQAAKFYSLLQMHERSLDWESRHNDSELVLLDLGSGPGTASLATLLALTESFSARKKELPRVRLIWWDTDARILEEGKALWSSLLESVPEWKGRVEIQTHCAPWWKASTHPKPDLVLFGNVLNESDSDVDPRSLPKIHEWIHGASMGVLWVEPAFCESAQRLSRLRDLLLEENSAGAQIVGPCLHSGSCPLARGRDWCHFSIPAEIPGKNFRAFSRAISTPRQWLKFSYLWMRRKSDAKTTDEWSTPPYYRVISDVLKARTGATVQLCQPQTPYRLPVKPGPGAPARGEIVRIAAPSQRPAPSQRKS